MLKFIVQLILVACVCASYTSALAQVESAIPVTEITANITGPTDIEVGRRLVLDASSSVGLGTNTTYEWFMNSNPVAVSRLVDMIFTPTEPGDLQILLRITTEIDGEQIVREATSTIIAYERKILLIADTAVNPKELAVLTDSARDRGLYVQVVQPAVAATPIATQEQFIAELSEQTEAVASADAVVLWSDDAGLLSAFAQAFSDVSIFREQTLVLITSRNLKRIERTIQGPFAFLQPKQIIITRRDALETLFRFASIDEFLQATSVDYVRVDAASIALKPWNILTTLVNTMLSYGLSTQIVILLLILPVIATILTFLKQIIGITTYGLYTPSILALSFLALGWQIGVSFLLAILFVGYCTRVLMARWRLLHIPKVAIILTMVSFTLLCLLALSAQFGLIFGRDTIFILLIMSTLAESLLNVKAESGWQSALLGMAETILAALLCVAIVQWSALQTFILAYPEAILLTIIMNIGMGRFTGLRLVEYFRFREVFRHIQEE